MSAARLLPGFTEQRIVCNGVFSNCTVASAGPPVLLLHGHPQTLIVWRKVAPQLVAAGYRVVASDLRGYGFSDKPASTPDHAHFLKRAMAENQVALMGNLGHDRFAVIGHDRGGRVAHRKFRNLGFIDYNGGIKINKSLLNVVLLDHPDPDADV